MGKKKCQMWYVCAVWRPATNTFCISIILFDSKDGEKKKIENSGGSRAPAAAETNQNV